MASTSDPSTPLSIPSSSSSISDSSPDVRRPLSSIITVPESWNSSLSNGRIGSLRTSMQGNTYRGTVEPPLPMSASSSSSSSQPMFDWPTSQSSDPYSHPIRRDPFDTSDPFDPQSSSSEDDRNPSRDAVRLPHHRSATDPLVNDGQPIDPEFSGAGPPVEGYDFEPPPAFIRTFSSPLPHRVGSLRHPLSPVYDPLGSGHAPIIVPTEPRSAPLPPTPLHVVSLELADSLQSAIQTLLHLSPPHLLDNAKEQYSGCTVQVPATSLSAILTSMRSLNFLAANTEQLVEGPRDGSVTLGKRVDFDIGELLQNVADMLSGQAAQKSVDLVLFHGDVGIKHVSVNGDGEGLSYALSHVIPQSPSMTPKIGRPLSATEMDRQRGSRAGMGSRSNSPGKTSPFVSSQESEGPLLCVFEIVHNICQLPGSASVTPKAELNPFTRLAEETEAAKPKLDTVLCTRLLESQNALLKSDVQPSSPLGSGLPRRAYELSVLLPRGKPIVEPTPLSVEEEAIRQPFTSVRLAREPTLDELSDFAESLRTKKVFIHANLSSVFARHLTSYLAAWGMDISHLPIDGEESEKYKSASQGRHDSGYGGSTAGSTPGSDVPTYTAMSLSTSGRDQGKFIIIDDDVAVLRKELFRIRAELHPLALKPRLNKRPSMSARTRSTPQVRQIAPRSQGAVLIHFTSLSKYNQVRDVVTSFVGAPWSTGSGAYMQPEVMVIPKPVGPRRFLTALHTAINQPIVDPFFSPIATSPRSPGGGYFAGSRTPLERESGFFDSVAEESSEEVPKEDGTQKARSPLGEYPPSVAQIIRTEQGLHLSLPTPGEIVATPASEYFSTAGRTPAAGPGASGVVMQSPDGRPYGMFFEPPNKSERRASTHRIPSDSIRRIPQSRRASAGGDDPTASPSISPQNARRISNQSQPTVHEERRSSFSDRPGAARHNSRRKTLPVSEVPIVAQGRDRSSTITAGSRRGTPAGSPTVSSPKVDQPVFHPPRVPKKAPLAELEDIQRLPATNPVKKKAPKDDVVVPPINVLIVEADGQMDIQLPVMDGIEATKEIRRMERYNNIGVFPSTPITDVPRGPVIESAPPASPFRSSVIIVALTASSLQSDRVAALAAGCNDFLTKPVSLKWLDKKIALIDFDGWRRWKSSDPKDANETKRGFTVGPQQAAKTLASRLRIERKGARSPAPASPEVHVQAPTPDPKDSPLLLQQPVKSPLPLQTSDSEAVSLSSIHEEFEHIAGVNKSNSTDSNATVMPDEKPLPPLPSEQ
ncbi:hypothetical protein IAR55_000375 [Kwoniella newhampshirensis]|uniref:Response regulatory domain-containing protein n=1 Tax=Kwoniella newhampshirensis TaxID=1651941 RepID=A0AAW0Z6H4_9TREE